ncbi:MAG: 50S ribosomal protein L3 [Alphaproteobacteria bacterium]|nr:50S ribosomal protein L3 [Alphaproteobacteria bacterium]
MANEMMGLLARKVGMTQYFKEDGEVVACTVLEAGPCTVLQVKTKAGPDGYDAIQLGFSEKKASRATKAETGHNTAAGRGENPPAMVREIRLADASSYERGQTVAIADVFAEGGKVDVVGVSKGKGTAGVMKRHNFKGFISTHGTHEFFRHGGSIGTRLTPGHVMKGKKMGGRMGNEQVTVQNLEIARIDAERNLLFVRGGVPGPNGSLLTVRQAVKKA